MSVGSINAAGAGLFGEGEDDEMAEYLINLWNEMTSDQVWRFWNSSNPVAGLVSEAGLLDNTPLYNFVLNKLKEKDAQIKKRVLVSANDAQTGAYVDFSLTEFKDAELIASSILGSAAVPLFFPP